MPKLLFWIVTIIGILPSIVVAIAAAGALESRASISREIRKIGEEKPEATLLWKQTASVKILGMEITVFPKGWAFWILTIGLLFCLVGVIALLHFPIAQGG